MIEFLADDFLAKGKDLSDYMKVANLIDQNTSLVSLHFDEVEFLHFMKENDGKLLYKNIIPGSVFQSASNGVLTLANDVRISGEKVKKIFPKFYNEIIQKNKTLFRFVNIKHSNLYFIGDTLYKTFGAKVNGIGGDFLRNCTLERDIALAAIMENDFFDCKGLIRSYGPLKKIMAIYSSRFKRVPFAMFGEIIEICENEENFGWKPEIKYWTISNKKTEMYFEFPDFINSLSNPTIIPGIKLVTSDTAYAQTEVVACWRNISGQAENHYVQKEFCIKHSTEVELDDIISLVKDAIKIQKQFYNNFYNYRNNLLKIPIDGKAAYKKAVADLINNSDMQKLVGQKARVYMVECLVDNYDSNKKYTKAEVFDGIIQFSDNISTMSTCQRESYRDVLSSLVA